MEISNDTEKVLEFLDYYSGNTLRKRSDLAVLLELSASYDLANEINDLIFEGTFFKNLNQTIRKAATDPSAIDKMEKEIKISFEKMKSQIFSIIQNLEDSDLTKRFQDLYFSNTQGSFRNMYDLASDLALLKEIQNTLKSSKK
ncbi:MAG: hypothetical protein N2319_03650 [Candidatus Kapabacteria bacterium]|nr:hypothetical protein [Candidatus Kapabacteria bacterium]